MLRFELPDIGEGIVEAEVIEWKVAEGDSVSEDQILVEIMGETFSNISKQNRKDNINALAALKKQGIEYHSVGRVQRKDRRKK